jgi:hypothetical protein
MYLRKNTDAKLEMDSSGSEYGPVTGCGGDEYHSEPSASIPGGKSDQLSVLLSYR